MSLKGQQDSLTRGRDATRSDRPRSRQSAHGVDFPKRTLDGEWLRWGSLPGCGIRTAKHKHAPALPAAASHSNSHTESSFSCDRSVDSRGKSGS